MALRISLDPLSKPKLTSTHPARAILPIKSHFDSSQARRMIDLAWFEDTLRPIEISIWDEATKKKMRQPVLANGYHHLSDEIVRNLIAFASLY